jgi:hypothetical protein
MKQITIGDVSIYSEDEDTWEDLIRVVRKANKAYMECVYSPRQIKKESWLRKLIKRTKRKLF